MLQSKINHADQKTGIPNSTVIKRLCLIELKLYELYQRVKGKYCKATDHRANLYV